MTSLPVFGLFRPSTLGKFLVLLSFERVLFPKVLGTRLQLEIFRA